MPVSTTTTTATQVEQPGHLKLRGHHEVPSTTAYAELDNNGFCVVPGVITPEAAKAYEDRAYAWLEGFGKGFKGDDAATWRKENLPEFAKGGLYNRHGAGHEQWAWDIRGEPALIDVFAKIWGTEELLVSVDGVNISLPFEGDTTIDRKPWPHVDQSPNRRFKHCIQGIMNLHENGPKDGGLMVLEGSYSLYSEFFEAHEHEAPAGGWDWRDSHHFRDPKHLQWFYDRGCKWKKIEAGPGDVILWDSRCIHYGAAAEGDRPRIATYVCYKPAKNATPEIMAARKEAMEKHDMTSHDPIFFRLTGTRVSGKLSEDEREQPLDLPILSERVQKLAGILAY